MERSSMAEMVSKVLEREEKRRRCTHTHTHTLTILNRLLSSMTANRQNCSF